MNYIKQINFYWEKARKHALGGGEAAVYMYLLHLSNTRDWENPITVSNAVLQETLGLKSINTLKAIRGRLQQCGLIQFKTKNGSAAVEYCLFDVRLKKSPQTSPKNKEVPVEGAVEVPVEGAVEVGVSVLLYNKPKPKLKQKERVPHTQLKILEPEEIKWQLLNSEVEIRDFICRQYQFSAINFSAAVALFIAEKTIGVNELAKPYPEVIKQFKAWVGYHRQKLQKQFSTKENGLSEPFWRRPEFYNKQQF